MARLHRPILGRSIYIALCLTIIMLRLQPFSTLPQAWPRPDLLVALTFVYALRRPQTVPPLVIAGIFLLADLLFLNPPGLITALMVISGETLRRRSHGLRSASAVAEWAMIAVAIAAITVLERAVLFVLMVPRPDLGPVLIGMIGTIAIVPAVDLGARVFLGLRRTAHGERDEKGHRI